MNISIVLPTHNRRHSLMRVLPLYARQEGVTEIIIINDGGEPFDGELLDFLDSLPVDVKLAESEVRRGTASSLNAGIEAATGDFLLFTADDIMPDEDFCSVLLQDMEEFDLAAGRVIPMHGDTPRETALRIADAYKAKPILINVFEGNYRVNTEGPIEVPFTNGLFLVSSDLAKDIYYDESYQGNCYREETDFQFEAGRRGARILFDPRAIAYHVHDSATGTGGHRRGKLSYEYWTLKNNHYFLRKHYDYIRDVLGIKGPKMWLEARYVLFRLVRPVYLASKLALSRYRVRKSLS